MKRIFVILLSVILLAVLCSCGKKPSSEGSNSVGSSTEENVSVQDGTSTEPESNTGNGNSSSTENSADGTSQNSETNTDNTQTSSETAQSTDNYESGFNSGSDSDGSSVVEAPIIWF